MKFCSKCNARLEETAKFCFQCGEPVVKESSGESISNTGKRNYRNRIVLLSIITAAVIVAIAVYMATLNPKQAPEELILADISDNLNLDKYGMEIAEFITDTRYYDSDLKQDIIRGSIYAKNNDVGISATFYSRYERSNKKWGNVYIENANYDCYALTMISQEQITKDLTKNYSHILEKYHLSDVRINADLPELTKDTKTLNLICQASAQSSQMTVFANIEAHYKLIFSDTYCGWKLISSDLSEYDYQAAQPPSAEFILKTISEICMSEEYEITYEGVIGPNTYGQILKEHDSEGFKDAEVDWEITLTYIFDPDKGGWYLKNDNYNITNANLNLNGVWSYSQGSEYIKLNIQSADENHVEYDFEYNLWPDNLFHIGFGEVSGEAQNKQRIWKYEYIEDELCLLFTAEDPIFGFTYVSDAYKDTYTLCYKAYLSEIFGKSGFYIKNYYLNR